MACWLCKDERRILFHDSDSDDDTTAAAAHRLFEKTLLDRLRSGPFREFEDLDEVNIVYKTTE